MGPPGCGKTSFLREMLFREFDYEQRWYDAALPDGSEFAIPYWWLPEWRGAVIGCTDQNPDYRSYKEYRDAERAAGDDFDPRTFNTETDNAWKISSSRGHDGISWIEAAALLQPDCQEDVANRHPQSPRWEFLFVEGYGPNQQFAEIAVTENWIISAYWIDVSEITSKKRLMPSDDVGVHWAKTPQMKELAKTLGAVRIDGEQEFEAVMADLWTAIMQDILPQDELGNLSRAHHLFRAL